MPLDYKNSDRPNNRPFTVVLTRVLSKLAMSLLALICIVCNQASGDELILDESLTEFQTVGDFNVSACSFPMVTDKAGLLDSKGEITAGQLYTFFKSKGLNSVNEICLSLDIVPTAIRSDYALNSIELSIEDLKYSLGDNSLRLPAYETSSSKPEAQMAVQLGYDFMEKFNASSTEKVKFNYAIIGGKSSDLKVSISPKSDTVSFSATRFWFLTGFAVFWVIVFFVLFRATAPKNPVRESKKFASTA